MIASLLLTLSLTASAADPTSPQTGLFDLVPQDLPPSRTHCTLSSAGDYHELSWDPVAGGDMARRLMLRKGETYTLSCVGEILPSLDEPVAGLTYPRRWAFSKKLEIVGFETAHASGIPADYKGTSKNIEKGLVTVADAYVTCQHDHQGDRYDTAPITCSSKEGRIYLHGVRGGGSRSTTDKVLAAELTGARSTAVGVATASGGASRLLGLDPTIVLDRLFSLAADVIVTEVRQAGLEAMKKELMGTLRCGPLEGGEEPDPEAPKPVTESILKLELDHTCEALETVSLEHLVQNREVLARALMLDLAELAPLNVKNVDRKKLLGSLVGSVAAIVLLEAGAELELGGIIQALESLSQDQATPDKKNLQAALQVLADCDGATCPADTVSRLISKKGGDPEKVAALVVALQAVLKPDKARTRVERVGDAIRLARLAVPKVWTAANDDEIKAFHTALDVLEALSQGHLGEAARRAQPLIPDQAAPFIRLAVAVGAVVVEIRAAGKLDDEAWELRSEQYKEAILVFLRTQRSRANRGRELTAGIGSTLAFEHGKRGLSGQDSTREWAAAPGLAVPIELGVDLHTPVQWPVASARAAVGIADLSSYAGALLTPEEDDASGGSSTDDPADPVEGANRARSDGSGGAQEAAERVRSAQRYSVSVGLTFRTGRIPLTLTATWATRPAQKEHFWGVRAGFLVPFLDRRITRF